MPAAQRFAETNKGIGTSKARIDKYESSIKYHQEQLEWYQQQLLQKQATLEQLRNNKKEVLAEMAAATGQTDDSGNESDEAEDQQPAK